MRAAFESKIDELARVNRSLKQKIFDLHTIFEITKQLNSILELDQLPDAILLVCMEQVGAKSAALLVPPAGREEILSTLHTRGMDPPQFEPEISCSGHLAETLQRKNRAVFLQELEQILPSGSKELELLRLLKAQVCTALTSKENALGILFLGPRASRRNYQPEDLEFLSTLVNNLAVILENARLYQSVKSANLEVRRTQAQLAEKEKLAALGELAAALGHEVNNPLGIIKNYLALLEQESKPNQEAGEHIKVIQEELGRVTKIIQQLLNLYHPQKKEEFKQTDLALVLGQTLDLVESELKKKDIVLERKMVLPLPLVPARPEELKQVFLNLLMNSRDFTPAGGKISVSLAQKNGGLEIEFKDTGPGIAEKDLTKIFSPFFTTKEKGRGTGIGLSICQRIIQDHRGSIEAKNVQPQGASFLIRLPLE